MARRSAVKKHDAMAAQMVKLVRSRPWLGWRHRQPMERYTASRRRNALLQAGMNGGFAVVNVATGKVVMLPLMALITYQMGRTYHRLGTDPAPHQAEWQQVRDALAAADLERSQGGGRRLPSARSLLLIPVVTTLLALQMKLFVGGSWSTLLLAGIALGLAVDLADVWLHLRHAPGRSAPVVIDLVALEAATDEVATHEAAPAEAEDVVEEHEGWDGVFPIARYDELSVQQVLPLLPKLYWDELPLVEERERAGKGRRTILSRLAELDALLIDAPDDVTAEEWLASRPRRLPREGASA